MPITEFAELANTRVGTEDQREIRWRVRGTDVDDRDVFNYAIVRIAQLGLSEYDGMPQSEPLQIEHVRDYDPEYWIVTARYQRQGSTRREQQDQDPESTEFKLSFDFDFTSEIKTRLFSRRTKAKFGRRLKFDNPNDPDSAKEFVFENSGGINLDEEDRPQGTDIFTPAFQMKITFTPPIGFVNGDYIRKVARLAEGSDGDCVANSLLFPIVGRNALNSARQQARRIAARGEGDIEIKQPNNSLIFDAGEVLFVGARFPLETNKIPTITYEFLVSPTRHNVTVPIGIDEKISQGDEEGVTIEGTEIVIGRVEGFDLVHVRYTKIDNPEANEVDNNGKRRSPTILVPDTVYVEEIYDRKDLNGLFLPGSER